MLKADCEQFFCITISVETGRLADSGIETENFQKLPASRKALRFSSAELAGVDSWTVKDIIGLCFIIPADLRPETTLT